MADRIKEVSTSYELQARENSVVNSTINSTQFLLAKHFGLTVNLQRARFVKDEQIAELDLQETLRESDLAKVIREKGLPIPLSTQLSPGPGGIIIENPTGPQLVLSMDLVGNHFLFEPKEKDRERKEIQSVMSLNIFRQLVNYALEMSTPTTTLAKDSETVLILRRQLIEYLREYALGEKSEEVLNLVAEVELKTKAADRLSVKGKGDNFSLAFDDSPVLSDPLDDKPIAILIASFLEPYFVREMQRRIHWFIAPDLIDIGGKRVDTNFLDVLEYAQESYPDLGIPNNPKDILNMYISSQYAKRRLADFKKENRDETSLLVDMYADAIEDAAVPSESTFGEEAKNSEYEEDGEDVENFQRFTTKNSRRRAE